MNEEADEDFYIVMKLVSGEDVMCSLLAEDEEYIEVMDPIQIGSLIDAASHKEVMTVKPLCQFSSERTFVLQKKNIIYIKPLAHAMTQHYLGLTSRYEELIAPEDLSVKYTEEELEESLSGKFFVEGTDTYN
jgi:hypothetical protein